MSQTPLIGTATGPSIPVTLEAGGDLSGVIPIPTVTGLRGTPICVTAPALNDVLTFDGTEWCPSPPAATGLVSITDSATTVAPVTSVRVPLGGVTDNGGDEAGLNVLTSVYGEQAKLVTVAASGAAYTIDWSLGNTFDITLTANCTIGFLNIPGPGVDAHIVVIYRQGGSGSYTVTHPASVVWQDVSDGTDGGSAPTLWTAVGASNTIEYSTVDGGITVGGQADVVVVPLTIKDDGTPLATAASSLDFVGVGVTASGATSAKTITIPGLTVDDEGTPLSTAATTLNFVGAGVTASGTTTTKTITIPGGATAADSGIWRPLLDSATGAIIVDGTTGEATMGFGSA